MNRSSAVILSALILLVTSCDGDYPYDCEYCHCHDNGNTIGGWDEEGKDTTDIGKKDPAGGFEVTLDGWDDPVTQDAHL